MLKLLVVLLSLVCFSSLSYAACTGSNCSGTGEVIEDPNERSSEEASNTHIGGTQGTNCPDARSVERGQSTAAVAVYESPATKRAREKDGNQ